VLVSNRVAYLSVADGLDPPERDNPQEAAANALSCSSRSLTYDRCSNCTRSCCVRICVSLMLANSFEIVAFTPATSARTDCTCRWMATT